MGRVLPRRWPGHQGLHGRQPLAPGGRRRRPGGHRARQAGAPGRPGPADHPDPHPRRRGFHRPGRSPGDLQPLPAGGLQDRRHDPHHRQQPDRLHDGPDAGPFHRLRDRPGQGPAGPDPARQRGRPRGRHPLRAPGLRVPQRLPQGRHHRHGVLPPPRSQRGRRPVDDPARHVLPHRPHPLHARCVHPRPGWSRPAHRGRGPPVDRPVRGGARAHPRGDPRGRRLLGVRDQPGQPHARPGAHRRRGRGRGILRRGMDHAGVPDARHRHDDRLDVCCPRQAAAPHRPRAHALPGGLRASSEAASAVRAPPRDGAGQQADRLGLRRAPGLRHAPHGGHRCAPVRRGRGPRDLRPASRNPARRERRARVHAAALPY